MNKKNILFLILILNLLILTACNSNIKENDNNNKKEEVEHLSTFKCNSIQDIVDYDWCEKQFITKNGELYSVSFNQLFSSTNTNCKKIDTEIKVKKFVEICHMGSSYVLSNENVVYKVNNNNNYDYSLINTNDIQDDIQENNNYKDYYKYIDKVNFDNILFSKDINNNIDESGIYYYTNNKLYECDDNFNCNKLIKEFDSDEKVEYIAYKSIKTNKKVYHIYYEAMNQYECSNYADVECIYGVNIRESSLKYVSDYFDNILFSGYEYSNLNIVDGLIVYKDGKVYQRGG